MTPGGVYAPEPRYACGRCLDSEGWVEQAKDGVVSVVPCRACNPKAHERWMAGKWRAR